MAHIGVARQEACSLRIQMGISSVPMAFCVLRLTSLCLTFSTEMMNLSGTVSFTGLADVKGVISFVTFLKASFMRFSRSSSRSNPISVAKLSRQEVLLFSPSIFFTPDHHCRGAESHKSSTVDL